MARGPGQKQETCVDRPAQHCSLDPRRCFRKCSWCIRADHYAPVPRQGQRRPTFWLKAIAAQQSSVSLHHHKAVIDRLVSVLPSHFGNTSPENLASFQETLSRFAADEVQRTCWAGASAVGLELHATLRGSLHATELSKHKAAYVVLHPLSEAPGVEN